MRECRGVITSTDLSSRGSEMTSGGYALDKTAYHSAEAERQTIAVTPAGKTEPPIHPWCICLDSERNPEGGHGKASTNANHAPMSPCFVMISNMIPPISGVTKDKNNKQLHFSRVFQKLTGYSSIQSKIQ